MQSPNDIYIESNSEHLKGISGTVPKMSSTNKIAPQDDMNFHNDGKHGKQQEQTMLTGQRGNDDPKMQPRTLTVGQTMPELGHNQIRTSKYTIWSFFPLNLFEQFKKIANIYFLVLVCMQMVKAISISGGSPTIAAPLAFVIAVSMGKDFIEDMNRRKSDAEENDSPCVKYEWSGDGSLIKTDAKWKDLVTGDVVEVKSDKPFPADLLMVYSTNKKKDCFIMTKNLDGETNLKTREVCLDLKPLISRTKDIGKTLMGSQFNIEAPNDKIEKFEGSLSLTNGKTLSVGEKNILLRGCVLRNTEKILGIVTFSGKYTKIMQNSRPAKPKKSDLEKKMQKQILIIFAALTMFCTIASILYVIWYNNYKNLIGYIQLGKINVMQEFFIRIGNWILIFGNFVPISLLVTIETVKFVQAIFIAKDETMYTKKCDSKVIVQSSNLNEELGQISYVFSDKTGTLTCNEMIFKKCIVEGAAYGDIEQPGLEKNYPKVENVNFTDITFMKKLQTNEMKLYCKVLALCHMIITEEKKNGDIQYNSSSPDEIALTNFAKYCGHEYRGVDESGNMILKIDGKETVFKKHYILEFNSTRKRQSVIFEESNGDLWLYTKGADNVMMERASTESKNRKETKELQKNLDKFAKEGLRTLVLGVKKITPEEWKKWQPIYKEATQAIGNRKKKVMAAQEKIENGLFIIGATAIEDKLQDQVPQVIAQLKKAGIRVWVLTGDKVETAKTIGYSCNLLQDGMKNYEVIKNNKEKINSVLTKAVKDIKNDNDQGRKVNRGIIVTGAALETIFDPHNEYLKKKLNEVAQECEAVLCCRVSPLQKQQIVVMVKKCVPTARTLSIGDGANDVQMITAAHVGIGIKGVEGQQAARSSDYAIGEFKHLRRLIFYYGRDAYRKNTNLVLYSFYKNIVLVLPQFWYAVIFGNLSGVTLYDAILYQFVNVLYTAAPIFIYATLDRDAPDTYLERSWQYYFPGPQRLFFNGKIFWLWFFMGSFQALLISVICYVMNYGPQADGIYVGFWGYGILVLTCTILVPNLKILIFSNSFHFLNLFFLIGSVLLYLVSVMVINLMPTNNHYGLFSQVFLNMNTLLILLVVMVVTYHVDNLFTKFQNAVFFKGSSPTSVAKLNIKQKDFYNDKGYQNQPIGYSSNRPASITTDKSHKFAPKHFDTRQDNHPLRKPSISSRLKDANISKIPSSSSNLGSKRNHKHKHGSREGVHVTIQKRDVTTPGPGTENSGFDLDSSKVGLFEDKDANKRNRSGTLGKQKPGKSSKERKKKEKKEKRGRSSSPRKKRDRDRDREHRA